MLKRDLGWIVEKYRFLDIKDCFLEDFENKLLGNNLFNMH